MFVKMFSWGQGWQRREKYNGKEKQEKYKNS